VTTETALLLTAMALCAAAALVLSYLHWKAQKPGQRDHLKKAKSLDGLLRGHPRPMKPFATLAVAALAFAVLAWHVAPDYVSPPAFTSDSPRSAATGSACRCVGCGCKGGPGWRGQYGQCVSHANLTRDCGSPPSTPSTHEVKSVEKRLLRSAAPISCGFGAASRGCFALTAANPCKA